MEEISKQISEMNERLKSFLDSQSQNNASKDAAEIKRLEDKVKSFEKEILYLLKVVRDGNGKPSIIKQLDDATNKVWSLEKELKQNLEMINEKIESKFESFQDKMDLKMDSFQTAISSEIKTISKDLQSFVAGREQKIQQDFEMKKIEATGWWGIKTKFAAAIFAVLCLSIAGYLNFFVDQHKAKLSQGKAQVVENQEIINPEIIKETVEE